MRKLHPGVEGIKAMPSKKTSLISIFVVIGLVVGVCTWITIHYLHPAIRLAYVDSAISTLRMVNSAEKHFAQTHPDRGYACAFTDFPANELPAGIATSGQRNGYAFELICPRGNGDAPRRSFQITAHPLEKDLSAYCSDQSGIVKYDEGGSTARCLLSGTGL
jgi:hypothetical protein